MVIFSPFGPEPVLVLSFEWWWAFIKRSCILERVFRAWILFMRSATTFLGLKTTALKVIVGCAWTRHKMYNRLRPLSCWQVILGFSKIKYSLNFPYYFQVCLVFLKLFTKISPNFPWFLKVFLFFLGYQPVCLKFYWHCLSSCQTVSN